MNKALNDCVGCGRKFKTTYFTYVNMNNRNLQYLLTDTWCDECIRQEMTNPGTTYIAYVYKLRSDNNYNFINVYKNIISHPDLWKNMEAWSISKQLSMSFYTYPTNVKNPKEKRTWYGRRINRY